MNLNGQFPRRGENERADLASATVDLARLISQPVQDGQSECGRLAGSGLSTAENVPAL